MKKYPRLIPEFHSFRNLFYKINENKVNNLIKKKLNLSNSQIIKLSSGRDSLSLILQNLNKQLIKENKKNNLIKNEIIVSSFNFSLTAKIIVDAGFKPIFVDCDLETFNINIEQIKKKITQKTCAIIVTHIFGNPCKMNEILKISKAKKIFLIEDCAHVFGNLEPTTNKNCGSIGDASFFSLQPSKPLNCLYGGLVVINNNTLFLKERIVDKVSMFFELKKLFLNNFASLILNKFIFNYLTYFLIYSIKNIFNFNFLDYISKDSRTYKTIFKKMGYVNLNILYKQLNNIHLKNQKLIFLSKTYNKYLNPKIKNQELISNVPIILFPVFVDNLISFKNEMFNKGIDIKYHFMVNISPNKKNNAIYLEKHLVYLPFSIQLNNKDIKNICDRINSYFDENKILKIP